MGRPVPTRGPWGRARRADERITTTPRDDVVVQLRRPWADGTTHLVFEPKAFFARPAVLVPRPRVHLVLYHGVLGPRAVWRREAVPTAASQAIGVATTDQPPAEHPSGSGTRRILRHLDLPTDVPAPTPAHAPPGADDWAC